MNRVIILGRLGKDPELKTFEGGGQVCNFTVATDESYKDKDGNKVEKAEWHNVTFSGKVAEVVAKYFHKGSRILVEGKLRTRSWEYNGEKRYMTEIVGHNFEFVDTKKDNQTQSVVEAYKASQDDLQLQEEEDDLPF